MLAEGRGRGRVAGTRLRGNLLPNEFIFFSFIFQKRCGVPDLGVVQLTTRKYPHNFKVDHISPTLGVDIHEIDKYRR